MIELKSRHTEIHIDFLYDAAVAFAPIKKIKDIKQIVVTDERVTVKNSKGKIVNTFSTTEVVDNYMTILRSVK